MADDNVFSANFAALERAGVHLQEIGKIATEVANSLKEVMSRYPNLGGNGQFEASFKTNYYPVAEAGTTFAQNTADLLDLHGSETRGLGLFLGDVNETATTEAGGTGRRG
jgi:hypothetical protein